MTIEASNLRRGMSPGVYLPFAYDKVAGYAIALDLCLILAASLLAGTVYHFLQYGTRGDELGFAGLAAVVAAIFVPVMTLGKLYDPTELLRLRRQIKTAAAVWAGTFVFLATVVFSLKLGQTFSRGAVLSFAGLGGAVLVADRLFWWILLRQAFARGALQARRIALVEIAAASSGDYLRDALNRHGYSVVQYHLVSPSALGDAAEFRNRLIKVLVSVRGSDVEEIFLSADWQRTQPVLDALQELRVVPLPVRFIPDERTASLITRPWRAIGSVTAVEVQRAPLTGYERALKRGFDLICASTAVLMLLPLFLISALAVKLDSAGPVFFRQTRLGFNGKAFKILKFRSMTVLEDGDVVRQATREDVRVTRVGYWLRRTSIDELPQLFNVLRGEMSIVGPRPHALAHDNFYDSLIADYALRHHVRPGLTGWAQVHGLRGETPDLESMARRVELDLWYVDNWTIFLDAVVLFRTVREIIRPRNAY